MFAVTFVTTSNLTCKVAKVKKRNIILEGSTITQCGNGTHGT